MSPGLKRAREPFRIRNAVTGVLLFGFAVGVWAYSIGAVKQDVFDDVDEEARALARSGVMSLEDQAAERRVTEEATKGAIAAGPTSMQAVPPAPTVSSLPTTRPRGVLPAYLLRRYPGLFHPTTHTLVWGAPPVDDIGKMSDPSLLSRDN